MSYVSNTFKYFIFSWSHAGMNWPIKLINMDLDLTNPLNIAINHVKSVDTLDLDITDPLNVAMENLSNQSIVDTDTSMHSRKQLIKSKVIDQSQGNYFP